MIFDLMLTPMIYDIAKTTANQTEATTTPIATTTTTTATTTIVAPGTDIKCSSHFERKLRDMH